MFIKETLRVTVVHVDGMLPCVMIESDHEAFDGVSMAVFDILRTDPRHEGFIVSASSAPNEFGASTVVVSMPSGE